MTYQEQLKDPRWQKKRLEIMERDEWTCQMCGDTEATLTVHHKSYKYKDGCFADIWDYDGIDLITLCDACHSQEEDELNEIKNTSYFKLREYCENATVIRTILSGLREYRKLSGKRISISSSQDIFGYVIDNCLRVGGFTGEYTEDGKPICICQNCGDEFYMVKDMFVCVCTDCQIKELLP